MEVWIIIEGEKVGPLHDFEVRRKIETGEFKPTTPGWHDGLPAWRPLVEIGIFTKEFTASAPVEAPPDPAPDPADDLQPPPVPLPPPCYGRRFWARWFDLSLYAALWWLCMWAVGQNIEAALFNPWLMFFQFVPWFAIEALLLHYFATTPGKWLLGLRVVNHDGSRLDLSAATRRSVRVLFTGIGFGWPPLALMCHALSVFMIKRFGSTLWDQAGNHRVTVKPLSFIRITAFILLFFTVLQLQMGVLSPYIVRQTVEQFPALKAEFDRNPPWHLPERNLKN